MNQDQMESHLREVVNKLDEAVQKVIKTNGYADDAKKIKLLAELIKEQIRHENTLPAARPLR